MVTQMLQASKYIDVIIPRGGKSLVKKIQQEARVPVFAHLEGICHVYIDHEANIETALNILLNSKLRRTGICGAAETLLIDKRLDDNHVSMLISKLVSQGCEVRAEKEIKNKFNNISLATEKDWYTEYLDSIISVKYVNDVENAIKHINKYSSDHTETIVTENKLTAEKFLNHVDSAIVMHNASTQFADGGEFGMGAEIGISTGRLHARGPVGSEIELTVRRRGVKKALTFNITREIIEVKSVKSDLIDNNIGYLRLTSFNDNSSQQIKKQIKKSLHRNGLKNNFCITPRKTADFFMIKN